MKINKMIRVSVGGVGMLILTFAFLPVLLVNPDIEFFQNCINYLNRD